MTAGTRFDGRTAIVTGAARASAGPPPCAWRPTVRRSAASIWPTAWTRRWPTSCGRGPGRRRPGERERPDSVAAGVAAIEAEFGPTRILANVAGVLRFGIFHESSVEDFDLQIAVNLKGPFLMARAVIPSMLANGGGAIATVASSAGVFGQAYMPGYAASKGGVAMLSRAIAWEYQKLGIRSNAVAPGGVETAMTSDVDFPEGIDFELIEKTTAPDYRMMQPEEPAALIAFLSSDEAAAINGTVIPIDFGITA